MLDERSRRRLQGVHPRLVEVVERAAELTPVRFVVTEGVRTVERQRQLVAQGASQTMASRHITGHATDLAAVMDGEIRWDWPLYPRIAEAVREAASELGTPIVWGGAWGRLLNDVDSAAEAMDAYVAERRAQGRRPFMDGPHFELAKDAYP